MPLRVREHLFDQRVITSSWPLFAEWRRMESHARVRERELEGERARAKATHQQIRNSHEYRPSVVNRNANGLR